VCRACARRCHSNHMTKVKFSRWTVSQNRCGCADSGRCRVVYSSERGLFDSLVDRSNVQVTSSENKETISMQFFRELLKLLHPEGLSEDDIDSGEVALHSVAGSISWTAFEKWHTPYFEVRSIRATRLCPRYLCWVRVLGKTQRGRHRPRRCVNESSGAAQRH